MDAAKVIDASNAGRISGLLVGLFQGAGWGSVVIPVPVVGSFFCAHNASNNSAAERSHDGHRNDDGSPSGPLEQPDQQTGDSSRVASVNHLGGIHERLLTQQATVLSSRS